MINFNLFAFYTNLSNHLNNHIFIQNKLICFMENINLRSGFKTNAIFFTMCIPTQFSLMIHTAMNK